MLVARPVEGVPIHRQAAVCGLTERQQELLTFIRTYYAEHHRAPSFHEMKDGIGLKSKSAVHRLIVHLEARGHLVRVPSRARAIMPANDGFAVHLRPDVHEALLRHARDCFAKPETIITEAVSAYLLGEAA
jgi:SOS-response transcriptional repressor LexA